MVSDMQQEVRQRQAGDAKGQGQGRRPCSQGVPLRKVITTIYGVATRYGHYVI